MKFLVTGGAGFIGWRVVRTLLDRGIPTVIADWNVDPAVRSMLEGRYGEMVRVAPCDVSEFHDLAKILHAHPDITHVIHLAYLMSAEAEADPHLGARVNILGMVNVLEIALQRGLKRVVFTSSETVYGASQARYGDHAIGEDEFCSPADHFFTYGVMKLLNEFTARKYVQKHGMEIACARPPVVFGHGRKHGAVLWAESFVSLPAIGKPVRLPFAASNRDGWVYVDDCAEQLVRLALKPSLKHFAYNSSAWSVTAGEFAAEVRRWIPDAEITFDESIASTPLVDQLDGSRMIEEIDFRPRPLSAAILAHINEARAQAHLAPIAAK